MHVASVIPSDFSRSVFAAPTAVAVEPFPAAAAPGVFEFAAGFRLLLEALSERPEAALASVSPGIEDFRVPQRTGIWITHLIVQ